MPWKTPTWLEPLQRFFTPRPELPVLLAVLAVVGSVWLFVMLGDYVSEGKSQSFDTWVNSSLRRADNPRVPRGPAWLVEVGRDVTALGGPVVLTMITVAAAGYLFLQRKRHAMVLMLLAIVSGVLLSTLLKHVFDRDRPAGGSDLVSVMTSSFPSGHSMLSAVVYLVLGTMLARTESKRSLRVYFMSLAILLTLIVGLSRIFMLVHYPTDVLGGWTAGLGWALVWWLIARSLQHRGQVEPAESNSNQDATSKSEPQSHKAIEK